MSEYSVNECKRDQVQNIAMLANLIGKIVIYLMLTVHINTKELKDLYRIRLKRPKGEPVAYPAVNLGNYERDALITWSAQNKIGVISTVKPRKKNKIRVKMCPPDTVQSSAGCI